MSTVLERIEALCGEAETLVPWTGYFDRELLAEWVALELGEVGALDGWVRRGGVKSRAAALSPVLHVVSGNTEHAAFQSVLRGLLVGCRNRVKVPSAGLPEFEAWTAGLPGVLGDLVEVRRDLPDDWLACEAAVVFGGGETIEVFRRKLAGGTRLIEHGPKLSIAVVLEISDEVAGRLAEDVLRFDQRGCLSVQAVYVRGGEKEIFRFGEGLAIALADWRKRNGRLDFRVSDSGAVANARELARFREANGAGVKLWESVGSTEWTVVYDRNPVLSGGPLNGFVTLHPLPEVLDRTALGPEVGFVSTVVLHPFSEAAAAVVEGISPPRICEAGKAQEPTIFWHHDGMPPLGSLVRWRDLG